MQHALFRLEDDLEVSTLVAAAPTPANQRALLRILLSKLAPALRRRRLLEAPFVCEPGLRLRRRYGLCRFPPGQPPNIQVRLTRDDDRHAWRRPSAIVATLVHELAHLRFRAHAQAFWQLCRQLLDDAAALGLYTGESDDPSEQPQGRTRLAGSAADAVVVLARRSRQQRDRAARELVAAWPIGAWARLPNGAIRGQNVVQVMLKRRTRLVVQTRSGRRYLVPARLLEPLLTFT